MPHPHRLLIVVGSTRDGRATDHLLPWLTRRTAADDRFDVEVVDLRDWHLPMFQETAETIGDLDDPTYSDPVVRAWNRKMAEGDAVVFVTAEYNHTIPAVLKNAIDSVYVSFALRNKPAMFVGYSGGPTGAARAVEHLSQIVINMEMVPLRTGVLIGGIQSAFDDDRPTNPMTDAALTLALDDLAWWTDALVAARAAGELPPAMRRMGAALAAARANATES